MHLKEGWLLKKDRVCDDCGAVFPKGTKVGNFLSHVQRCGKPVGNSNMGRNEYKWNAPLLNELSGASEKSPRVLQEIIKELAKQTGNERCLLRRGWVKRNV